ncbi:unnamed protein product, partial [Prunus armeniaca]
ASLSLAYVAFGFFNSRNTGGFLIWNLTLLKVGWACNKASGPLMFSVFGTQEHSQGLL